MEDLINGTMITLNNDTYVIVNQIEKEEKVYLLLANFNNPEDIFVRIKEKREDTIRLVELKNEEEFDLILKEFKEKFENRSS